MNEDTRRAMNEGLRYGVAAGILFGVVEVAAAAAMGDPPLMPLRMFASVVLGGAALESTNTVMVVCVGIGAHLVLSAIFGLAYGLLNAGLSLDTQTLWSRQAALGLVFGVLLWFVNFQLIARILYPWFLQAPQGLQIVMHGLFFGLPVALLFARAERHVHHIGAPAAA